MRPIILITLYRRYYELQLQVENIQKLIGEFKEKPYIIVVWASPEPSRYWVLEDFLNKGLIDEILPRLELSVDGVNKPTTMPESANLKLGLEYIRDKFIGQNYYIIGSASDIIVKDGIYYWIDTNIQDTKAILFFWNGGISQDAWHTNFFVVKEELYWPPTHKDGDFDTLEVQWGKYISDNNIKGFIRSHNSRGLKFDHLHLSESLPQKEKHNIVSKFELNCTVVGYKSIWYYIKFGFNKGIQWLKFW